MKKKINEDNKKSNIYKIENLGNNLLKNIFLKSGKNYKKINPENILWLSADGNHININFVDSKYTIRTTFKNIMTLLPVDKFYQVHKSFMVNLEKVESIEKNYLVINNVEIPISRKLRNGFIEKFNLLF